MLISLKPNIFNYFKVEDLKKFIKDNAVLAFGGGTVLREEL